MGETNPACDDECPVRLAAELVGHKWTTLIVRDLLRSISGISPRMLAARLKALEGARLITRTVFPTIPPTTEYALTPLGFRLESLIGALAEFGMALRAGQADAGNDVAKPSHDEPV